MMTGIYEKKIIKNINQARTHIARAVLPYFLLLGVFNDDQVYY